MAITKTQDVITIRSRGDLVHYFSQRKRQRLPHLVLMAPFAVVHELLTDACVEPQFFSIIGVGRAADSSFREAASAIDTIPFFIVDHEEEGFKLASELAANPHQLVLRAINGDAVALRYLEGAPS